MMEYEQILFVKSQTTIPLSLSSLGTQANGFGVVGGSSSGGGDHMLTHVTEDLKQEFLHDHGFLCA